jgi:integrase
LGVLVWLAMVTGARRGELCAMRWDRLDFAAGVLEIRTSIAQDGPKTWEKTTKTHQQRRIALDDQTLALLRAYHLRCVERAALVGLELVPGARLFSRDLDGGTWLKPDSVGQRYERMCARLGWDMNLHQLRHYSATELISAGVDIRTVAGRLGHGGGGTTTLKVYSAWRSEVDQRAASKLGVRMPAPRSRSTRRCRCLHVFRLGTTIVVARTRGSVPICLARLHAGRFGPATGCQRWWSLPIGTGSRRARHIERSRS